MTFDETVQPIITTGAFLAGHITETLTVIVLVLQSLYLIQGILSRRRQNKVDQQNS